MPITTTSEIKSNLNITASTYDTQIAQLRPSVEKELMTFSKNWFYNDPIIQYQASTIAFVDGSPATITDTASQFVEKDFKAGYDILVLNSKYNSKKIFTMSSVSAGTITVTETDYSLVAEVKDWYVRLIMLDYPLDLAKLVADMVWEKIQRGKSAYINSESYMGQNVSYADTSTGTGYSPSIMNRIYSHRKLGIA